MLMTVVAAWHGLATYVQFGIIIMFLVQDVCLLCAAVYSCGAYSGWSIRKNRINGSFKVKSKDRVTMNGNSNGYSVYKL